MTERMPQALMNRGTDSTDLADQEREHVSRIISGVARALRAVLGAPDYERYLVHVTEEHPDARPLTRDEFARERLENRYNRVGNRCC